MQRKKKRESRDAPHFYVYIFYIYIHIIYICIYTHTHIISTSTSTSTSISISIYLYIYHICNYHTRIHTIVTREKCSCVRVSQKCTYNCRNARTIRTNPRIQSSRTHGNMRVCISPEIMYESWKRSSSKVCSVGFVACGGWCVSHQKPCTRSGSEARRRSS